MIIDAYDNDGIYLLGIGDVYLLEPSGDDGATKLGEYVDDDSPIRASAAP